MERIILVAGSTETLEYFSLQIAEYFLARGREVFLWDMKHPTASIEEFEKLGDPQNSILVTFNFIGMNNEGQFSAGLVSIWDRLGIRKICIMVDSPVYYYRQLSSHIPDLTIVCIDRYHRDFVMQQYPEYGEVLFMPLAGNRAVCDLWKKPGIMDRGDIGYFEIGDTFFFGSDIGTGFERWKERRIDALFIGNYVPLESLEPSVARLSSEYREFIDDIIRQMFEENKRPLESILMERLHKEFPDCDREEYLEACFQMVYIDLYVRNAYRGKIVTSLADSGIKVYCTGKDWNKAPCSHPENLYHTGCSVNSIECLQALSQAKLSLNMMPWFKAGAHDRVFSSMLQGCALLSDSSEYIDEILTEGRDYFGFSLDKPEATSEATVLIAKSILEHEEKAFEVAVSGYEKALENHTWKNRAELLEALF